MRYIKNAYDSAVLALHLARIYCQKQIRSETILTAVSASAFDRDS